MFRVLRPWAIATAAATGMTFTIAIAAPSAAVAVSASEVAELSSGEGRPKVKLDRLTFPEGVRGAATFKRHLRRALTREARRVDWGAGRGNRIEYRFSVDTLETIEKDGVLRVSCDASGRLPNGRTARSNLSFGGAPNERTALIKRVLEIVARGVIVRLAELERQRRGQS